MPVKVHFVQHHEYNKDAPETYTDGQYVQVNDGHLFVSKDRSVGGGQDIVATFAPGKWHHAEVTK